MTPRPPGIPDASGGGASMHVLFVDSDGRVHAGRLTSGSPQSATDPATLTTRAGRLLAPSDVVALLTPAAPTEDQRALLWRAARAGYRVEAQ